MNVSLRHLSSSSSLQRTTKSIHIIPSRTPLSSLRTTLRFQSRNLTFPKSATTTHSFTRSYVTAQELPKKPAAPTTSSTRTTSEPLDAPGASRRPKDDKLKAWPFILIFVIGAGTFAAIVDSRKDRSKPMPVLQSSAGSAAKSFPKLRDDGPIFSPSEIKVIFVLGGPGVGKGTQCAKLVKDYEFVHLSAGDLLREEQSRSGSQYGELIKSYIKDGKIVPMEVTIVLLENAMKGKIDGGKTKFLIDGFPRQMDQALKFEETVVPSAFTLFFDCDEDTMMKRIMERAKTSGRSDDNPDSVLKRFRTFKETSMPVVTYFEGKGKVVKVDAGKGVDAVYNDVVNHVADRLK